jgi:predicted MarR family transcription regulator
MLNCLQNVNKVLAHRFARGAAMPKPRVRPAASPRHAEGPELKVQFVTSAHLVSERSPEISELEFGLIMAGHAFGRWVVRCMAASGQPELTTLDVLVLHHVNHRERAKKVADICFILNVEDTHTVVYALRKLAALGLVAGERAGKEVFYATTAAGQSLVERYRRVRETCLVDSLVGSGTPGDEIAQAAQVLRTVSGLYDQAARAAASL